MALAFIGAIAVIVLSMFILAMYIPEFDILLTLVIN
jgi:hypothetical protein